MNLFMFNIDGACRAVISWLWCTAFPQEVSNTVRHLIVIAILVFLCFSLNFLNVDLWNWQQSSAKANFSSSVFSEDETNQSLK